MNVDEFLSLYGAEDEVVENFLSHHGVKGQKWGIRRNRVMSEEERTASIEKIKKSMPKFGSEKHVRTALGYQLRDNKLDKLKAKAAKKNSSFSYAKLSEEQKAEFQKRAAKSVTRSTVLKGSAQVAAILAGGAVTGAKLGKSPEAATGAAIASLLVAGKVGKTRAVELRAVRNSNQQDKKKAKIAELSNG